MLVSKTNALPLGYTPINNSKKDEKRFELLLYLYTLTFKASTLDRSVTQIRKTKLS